MKQGEKMLKKLTQQATDLILHSIASGEVMGANFLITKGNEELSPFLRPVAEQGHTHSLLRLFVIL